MYIPKQRDIVWIDFDPSKGKEIKKRRPALVVSTHDYSRTTGFCIVSPITSHILRDNPTFYTLTELKTKGQVAVAQIYTMDYTKDAGRNIQYIEQLEMEDFLMIQQIEKQMLGFTY